MGLIALIVAGLCIAGTPADPDLSPMYCPARANAKTPPKDGRVLTPDDPPKGVADTKLRILVKLSARRDEYVESAGAHFAELEALLRTVESSEDSAALKKKLQTMSGDPLDDARDTLIKAVQIEKRRLVLLDKLAEEAFKAIVRLPGTDRKLVERLLEKYRDGDVDHLVESYTAGLRLVAEGVIEYLDEDLVAAVAKLKAATTECPDLAVAFLYLGSFSYILKQETAAIEAWRRVLELEPGNKVVRDTLKDLGVPLASHKRTDKRKRKRKLKLK